MFADKGAKKPATAKEAPKKKSTKVKTVPSEQSGAPVKAPVASAATVTASPQDNQDSNEPEEFTLSDVLELGGSKASRSDIHLSHWQEDFEWLQDVEDNDEAAEFGDGNPADISEVWSVWRPTFTFF